MLRVHLAPARGVTCTAHRRSTAGDGPVPSAQAAPAPLERRSVLLGLSSLLPFVVRQPQKADARPASPAPQVGNLFPPAAIDGFVTYSPDARKTPAIRAGVIQPEFYSFAIPSEWSEGTILNILSGNFCMPKCDEPWYEAIFTGTTEGTAKLIVSPLFRLARKPVVALQDIGPPEAVVEQIGQFITGTSLDLEDVTSIETKQFADGKTYYVYEVLAPYSKDGAHNLVAFTVKGDLAYLFVLSANEKQWAKSEARLRTMLETFRA